MQPARRFGVSYRFLHCDGEGNHVMPNLGFEFVDASHIHAGAFAQRGGCSARNDTCFRKRVGGGQLDLQPLLKFVLFAPDAAHFRASVTCDQGSSPE